MDDDFDIFRETEPNAIERIGYSKNEIVEVLETAPKLPEEIQEILQAAYSLLDFVQAYLFEN